MIIVLGFFFKQKTAYEMRISDWSSDVCSSDLALSLLRELVGTRGDDYVAQLIKDALFRAAQSKIQGLPTGMPESETVDHIVETVVLGIEEGGWKTAADVVIATPKKEVRAWLDYIFKPYNFLKHADREPLATLDESDLDRKSVV